MFSLWRCVADQHFGKATPPTGPPTWSGDLSEWKIWSQLFGVSKNSENFWNLKPKGVLGGASEKRRCFWRFFFSIDFRKLTWKIKMEVHFRCCPFANGSLSGSIFVLGRVIFKSTGLVVNNVGGEKSINYTNWGSIANQLKINGHLTSHPGNKLPWGFCNTNGLQHVWSAVSPRNVRQ